MRQLPLLLFAAFLVGTLCAKATSDGILLRDGREMSVNIVQVDNDRVLYKGSKKKNAPEMWLDLRNIYMLRYETRGNIYITADGKRVTGEFVKKRNKNASAIYLTQGREIIAYGVHVLERKVTYYTSDNRKNSALVELPYDDVFLIKYPDGTKDILNSMVLEPEDQPELAAPSTVAAPVAAPVEAVEAVAELQVVFHNVKKGETLQAIADRYDVDPKDIIKWNDLPGNTRHTTALRSDMQLMLYVKPSK